MFKKCFSIILFILFGTTLTYSQDDVVKLGEKAPQFSYKNTAGETIQLNDLKAKVILISFFAIWCGPCRTELPILEQQIWKKYQNNPDFELLVIGREHSAEEINLFKKNNNYSMPMFADPDKNIYSKFALKYIPRNYIIDKQGVIVYSSQGYSETEFKNMELMLEKLLEK